MEKYRQKAKIDKKPLWEYLNLDSSFTFRQVNRAYLKLDISKRNNQKVHLAWKILSDQYFCDEYKSHQSTERIFESGFFDDGLKSEFFSKVDFLWSKTPVGKISKNLESVKGNKRGKKLVLLMTGAFSPVHRGHTIYMDIAKEELEKRGFSVVGGYLSPSHDEYVSSKDGGRAKMDAKYRSMLCRKAVSKSSWLMVDDWESQHVTRPITYTAVYSRLKKYLALKFSQLKKIEVCLVVGGDNAAYARSMAKHGYCVCIERNNSKKTFEQISEESEIKNNERITMVSYKDGFLDYSSSSVRRGKLFMMDDEIRGEYKRIKS